MTQVIKNQWPKAGNWRHEISNQRTMINRSQPETCDQQQVTSNQTPVSSTRHPASSIQHPVSSIQYPVSGFTLLEVLIAMAIMAIVLVSVYRMHSQTLTMTTANRFYTQAPMLAQSKLAQLEANPSELIAGESGDFGEKFPGYHWSVAAEGVSAEALGETAEDLKRIDLTVALNENEYVYSIRTYRFLRE